jgi:hypothetical protein
MGDATGLSQRRACRLTGLSLSTCRYEAQRPAADAHLSGRITELALKDDVTRQDVAGMAEKEEQEAGGRQGEGYFLFRVVFADQSIIPDAVNHPVINQEFHAHPQKT